MEDSKHDSGTFTIKDIEETGQTQALDLAWRVFKKFEAPEYSEQGIESFRQALRSSKFLSLLKTYGAFNQEEMVGMLSTRNKGSHIALLFVDERFHRMGIGRKLFELALTNCPTQEMTVNSSPYAIEVYHALGFIDADVEQITDGIRYTPMVYKRKNDVI